MFLPLQVPLSLRIRATHVIVIAWLALPPTAVFLLNVVRADTADTVSHVYHVNVIGTLSTVDSALTALQVVAVAVRFSAIAHKILCLRVQGHIAATHHPHSVVLSAVKDRCFL